MSRAIALFLLCYRCNRIIFLHTLFANILTPRLLSFFFFFFNDPATPEFSPLPLRAALPISAARRRSRRGAAAGRQDRLRAARRRGLLLLEPQGAAAQPKMPAADRDRARRDDDHLLP